MMLAAYSTRRSSVVLNPRGRVLGGLGGGYEGEGTGVDSGVGGEGYTGFALARAEAESAALAAAQAAQDAQAAAKEAAQFASAAEAAQAQAAALAAAEDAAMAAEEAAMFANIASISNVASKAGAAATKEAAKNISSTVSLALGFLGPLGKIASLAERVTGFIGNVLAGLYESGKNFTSGYADAQSALDGAKGYAGDNKQLLTQVNTLQKSLESVKNAGVEAAVRQLYLTYAKRQPDPGGLAYWSDRFGPTVTPDEVLQFQETLYANEPNLRPAVVTRIEPAAGAGTGLALPLIAAIAGYFILGS